MLRRGDVVVCVLLNCFVHPESVAEELPRGIVERFGAKTMRHGGRIVALAHSRDGRYFASSSRGDGTASIWLRHRRHGARPPAWLLSTRQVTRSFLQRPLRRHLRERQSALLIRRERRADAFASSIPLVLRYHIRRRDLRDSGGKRSSRWRSLRTRSGSSRSESGTRHSSGISRSSRDRVRIAGLFREVRNVLT